MNPKITVLMPVYNAEQYLKESIESILNQTFRDFEFLIINDGSTDRSKEIIRSYSDPRIRLLENETNLGIVRTLNRGIDESHGEYIARMDADDIAFPERLEKQVAFMESHPQVGVCGSWVKTFGELEEVWKRPEFNLEIVAELIFNNALNHPTVIMRKAHLDRFNLRYRDDFLYSEDCDLWAMAIGKFDLYNLQEPLLHYRTHDQQVSKTKQETQRSLSRKIHRFLLEKTGIHPTEDEMDVHETIAYEEFRCEKGYIDRVEKWLQKILEANERTKAYDQTSLKIKLYRKLTLLFERCPDVKMCPGKRIASSVKYWQRNKFLEKMGNREGSGSRKDILAHMLDRIFTTDRMVRFYNWKFYKRLRGKGI